MIPFRQQKCYLCDNIKSNNGLMLFEKSVQIVQNYQKTY